MQKRYAKTIALIALTVPLGACNSFLGIHFARHARNPEPAVAEAARAPATEAGRKQLTDGQTALAIESFQQALASGEPIAPAVNGLGVAYARLGRFELALQYFKQAMAADPLDPRYEANAARLMQSPTFAMRREADLAAAQLKAEQAAVVPATVQTASAAPTVGRLQRVSRGEVRIVTAVPEAAPLRSARVDSRFRPLVKITFADAPARVSATRGAGVKVDARFRPLVRVTLPEQDAPAAKIDTAGQKDARR